MTKTTALKPCTCSLFEFDLDVDREDDYSTGCTQMTHRLFAQGHDAKLVGFLVRAELAGHDISKREGGMLITYAGAVEAARTISDALAEKAAFQLVAAQGRAAKKADRPRVTKTPTQAMNDLVERQMVTDVPAPIAEVVELAPIEAMIKVGRWTYPAQIDRTTREATYKAKLGGTKTIAEGAYSVL